MTMAPERPEPVQPAVLLREARPRQWLKNVLVFTAPAAAGVLHEWPSLWRTIVAFVSLCAAASGTYFLNDVADVASDRLHPTKCHRPVAAGLVATSTAIAAGGGLLVLSLVIAATTGRWELVFVVALYITMTLAYSAWRIMAATVRSAA